MFSTAVDGSIHFPPPRQARLSRSVLSAAAPPKAATTAAIRPPGQRSSGRKGDERTKKPLETMETHGKKTYQAKKKTPAMCFYGFHVSMVFHGNKRIKQSNCSFTINCKRKKTVDHLHTGRPRVHAENPERELRSTGYPGPLERPTLMRFEKLLKEIRRPLQDVFD